MQIWQTLILLIVLTVLVLVMYQSSVRADFSSSPRNLKAKPVLEAIRDITLQNNSVLPSLEYFNVNQPLVTEQPKEEAPSKSETDTEPPASLGGNQPIFVNNAPINSGSKTASAANPPPKSTADSTNTSTPNSTSSSSDGGTGATTNTDGENSDAPATASSDAPATENAPADESTPAATVPVATESTSAASVAGTST